MKGFMKVFLFLLPIYFLTFCEKDEGKKDKDVITDTKGKLDIPLLDQGKKDPGKDPGTKDPIILYDPGKPEPYDPGGPTELDCKGFYFCASKCPKGAEGQACVAECQKQTSTDGMAKVNNWEQCIQQKGCIGKTEAEATKCVFKNCADEYYKCFSGNTYQSCHDMTKCKMSCPTDDKKKQQECIANCEAESSYDANKQFGNLIICLIDAGCYDIPENEEEKFNKCFEDNCLDPYFKCISGEIYKNCTEKLDCFSNCITENPNDKKAQQNCMGNCELDSTYQANMEHIDFLNCILDNCTMDPKSPEFEKCYTDKLKTICKEKALKCIPEGVKLCGDTWNCLNSCGTDKTCGKNCINNATYDAQFLLSELFDCIEKNCPTFDETCVTQSLTKECKTQYDNCINQA